ncbi:tripartite tricarboxylate transporter TctB family protein [Rhodobacteraceae bacterium R_SAG2]|nr:tripartite tricarboxylate transporter TctB family protein [Rhodobacteraceae bacterium R_SAG2]
MKVKYEADFILGVCGTVLGSAFLYQSVTLMYPSKVFPVFIAVAIIVISVLITAQAFISSSSHKTSDGSFSNFGKPVIVMAVATAYIVAIRHIGFYVASYLCIMGLSIIVTKDRPTLLSLSATAIAAVVYLAGVYFVFTYLLGSSIPSGMFF